MADLPSGSDQGSLEIVINDPTTPANKATVKAGTTSSVSSDTSLVVALSPNSPIPVGTNNIGSITNITGTVPPPSDLTVTGSLTSLSSVVTLALNGTSNINVDVSGSGFVGTIVVEELFTSSARVLPVQALNTSLYQSSITTNGNYRIFGVPVSSNIQVIFSSYTSGSANITIRASTGVGIVQAYQLNAGNLLATTNIQDASGNAINSQSNALNVNTKTPLVYSAPTTASVGTTSTLILAANSSRVGLYLSNTSTQQISLGFNGNAAAYQYGITLFPGEKFWMDEYSFSTGAIYAITSGTATYIGIQEII